MTDLPPLRNHFTQKAKIGANRTIYLSVDSETTPHEIWLRIKGDADAEKVVCFDTIARLISHALQSGTSVEAIGLILRGTQDDTRGAVRHDDRIKFCSGTLDYIGTHLLVYYAGRDDLAHVEPPVVNG